MTTPKREQFNQRVRSALVALLKHNAAQRGVSPRDELERIIESAYMAPAASVAAAASTPLAQPAAAGQRVMVAVDGTGIVVTGVVVQAMPIAAPIAAAEPSREPRTPYCDEPSQENWG